MNHSCLFRIILAIVSISCCLTNAQDHSSTLTEALDKLSLGIERLEAQDQGAEAIIAEAASELANAIDEQEVQSSGAYHALGNAYTLLGEHGYAMIAFRRGEQINPRDPRIQDSLSYVRDQIQIQVEPNIPNRVRAALISWRGLIPRSILWWSFISLFTLGWAILILRICARQLPSLRPLAITCLALACIPFAALGYEWSLDQGKPGVVVLYEINAMSGPDDAIYTPVYAEPLSAGVEGTLREVRDDWARLSLIDGTACWVPLDAISRINPPT
ncbi:MAG: hypothetical protein JJ916_10740 [Phycisphaerales bacterium]|nr:hypothetical protein [Phycisphaerales bacterium]